MEDRTEKNQKKDVRDGCVVKGQINFQCFLLIIICVYMFVLRNFFCPILYSNMSHCFSSFLFIYFLVIFFLFCIYAFLSWPHPRPNFFFCWFKISQSKHLFRIKIVILFRIYFKFYSHECATQRKIKQLTKQVYFKDPTEMTFRWLTFRF